MIYPAVVMKVVGFINPEGGIEKKPLADSNLVRVVLDNGNLVDIDFLSNDNELSSLKDYLYNKALSNLKSDKIKSASSDLVFNADNIYSQMIEEEKAKLNGDKKAMQKAIEIVAKKIMFNNALIQSASVFRAALACGNDNTQRCTSKSIYVKQDNEGKKQYSNSGIYAHASLENQIPIEISNIRKNTGEHIGYMRVVTSDLINSKQIDYLLDHIYRTLEKSTFLPEFIFNNKMSPAFIQTAREFNSIKQNKENPNIDRAKELIVILKNNLSVNRRDYAGFKVALPFLIPFEDFKKSVMSENNEKGKSPVQIFRDGLINLNFSKENPNTKQMLKKHILEKYFMPMLSGNLDLKLLAVYNIVAPNILGESDSWGFMVNNIDFSKLTFGVNDIDQIYKSCEELI